MCFGAATQTQGNGGFDPLTPAVGAVPQHRIAEIGRQMRQVGRFRRIGPQSLEEGLRPLGVQRRVGFGGFNQSYPTLGEALAAASRSTGWKVADTAQLDGDSRHYLDFTYRLDTSQLPSPLQLGVGSQADWSVGIERTLRID